MATSPIAASRLVARNISQSGYDAIQARFEAWIDAKADSAIASDALVGALNYSKDPDRVLAEAARIYAAAVANGEDSGSGLSQPAVEAIVDAKTAQLGSKFRGDWSAGDLAWSEDFSSGLPSGPSSPWTFDWASGTVGNPAFSVALVANSASNATRPAYANCLRIPSNGARDNDTSRATLDLNKIPALAGKALTTISYWSVGNRQLTGGSPTNQYRDAVTVRASATLGDNGANPWVKQTFPLASLNNDLVWESIVNGQANPNNSFWVTGIEISVIGQPYMLGEFALYKGQMWKSKANNNATTPGSSATWEAVAVNFNQVYTTATRPSASTSGDGAQVYDGDLNKPIWSDGSVWRDAGGTAV